QQHGPLAWKLQRLCRDHRQLDPWGYVEDDGHELDQRKEPLSRRTNAAGWRRIQSFYCVGLEDHNRNRLWYGDRQCQCVSGVPLTPDGQLCRAVTVLEEPRAPVTVSPQLSLRDKTTDGVAPSNGIVKRGRVLIISTFIIHSLPQLSSPPLSA